MKPKVSVLMPAYNAEKYIDEAVQSIADQTFTDWELIIVDDGSKDNTLNKLKDWKKRDARIKVFENERNSGIVSTRNKLIDLAEGEYIAWLDSDDIAISDRLEKQVKVLDADKDIAVVGGGLEFFKGDKVLSKRLYKQNDSEARKDIFKFSPISQGAAMYKKEYVVEVGKYDDKILTAEDLNLTFRLANQYKIANIGDIVIRYRQHENSETASRIRMMEINTLKIRFKYLFSKSNFKPNFSDYIYNFSHFVSLYLIPGKVKVWLFNIIRNR